MLRRIVFVITLALSVVAPGVPVYATAQTQAAVQSKDCVVYVTKTGHKYHRAGCQYLKGSAIKMSRSEALKDGYMPCKKCGGSECE